MVENLIEKKFNGYELTQTEYYEIVDNLLKDGASKENVKLFICLNSFGMTAREVLFLTKALRDSGKITSLADNIMEKHSTGGVGDPSSVVLVPILASLGYKVVKTSTESFMFTNGSADRFKAIPNFLFGTKKEAVLDSLNETNACIAYRDNKICPADRILRKIQQIASIETDVNLIAASIASKKLSSGAKTVLIDIKYGKAALVKNMNDANRLVKLLKYVFEKCGVKCVIVVTQTAQTIGKGVGNAIEMEEAIDTLKGNKSTLRDISIEYATELILANNSKLNKEDVRDMVTAAIDNGDAYKQFLKIVNFQGGDGNRVEDNDLFQPYKKVNFLATKDGYVGMINAYVYGEVLNRMCKNTHDNNLGISVKVKIGDYVKAGDVILTLYYKDEKDVEMYKDALIGSVRLTQQRIKPIKVIRKVVR